MSGLVRIWLPSGLVGMPKEVTDEMWMAYRTALGDAIKAAIADGTAKKMWSKRACGYRMTERQKCEARYKAMMAAFIKSQSDAIERLKP